MITTEWDPSAKNLLPDRYRVVWHGFTIRLVELRNSSDMNSGYSYYSTPLVQGSVQHNNMDTTAIDKIIAAFCTAWDLSAAEKNPPKSSADDNDELPTEFLSRNNKRW